MSIKENLMKKMMDNHLNKMTSEEKQKMMGQMMGGEGNPMMGMMSLMMGRKQ